MLNKRNSGLIAAFAAAFIAMTFAPATEAVAAMPEATFKRFAQNSQTVNTRANVVNQNATRKTVSTVTYTQQQPAPDQNATYRTVRSANLVITQAHMDGLAKSYPNLHARLVAANRVGKAPVLSAGEAQIVYGLAAMTRRELAAAGPDAAAIIPVVIVVIDALVRIFDPNLSTPFGKFWAPISCAFAPLLKLFLPTLPDLAICPKAK